MKNRACNRIVITGISPITPIGTGEKKFWQAACAGENGIMEIKSFDTSQFKIHKGCEVKDFKFNDIYINKEKKILGRGARFAVAATAMAIADARLDLKKISNMRIGVSVGSSGGEDQIIDMICQSLVNGQKNSQDRQKIFNDFPANSIAAKVAGEFHINGPHFTFSTACAAGNYAIGHAFNLIRNNRADVMIAGGVAPFSRIVFTGFYRLKTISSDVCRPFDKNRKGIILGEGAGFLILEKLENALQRKAPIYAEIAGFGTSSDSYHMTAPEPTGKGMLLAMNRALADSGLRPEDIDYINAHGTGTTANDAAESAAIGRLFNHNKRNNVKVSSIKSMIGHTLGAAGAIEAISSILSIKHSVIPPTINYETPDPQCLVNLVSNKKIYIPMQHVMSNNFAFGGNNASLVFKKFSA